MFIKSFTIQSSETEQQIKIERNNNGNFSPLTQIVSIQLIIIKYPLYVRGPQGHRELCLLHTTCFFISLYCSTLKMKAVLSHEK
jgi:hypothetical protein